MKRILVSVGFILVGLFSHRASQAASVEDLYIQIRSRLEERALFVPFQNVSSTNLVSPELVPLVDEIQKRRYVLAEFLCAKFATQDRLDITDAVLLRDVARIDLIWSEKLVSVGVDIHKSIHESFQRFKGDYAAKAFENPGEAIRKSSASLQAKSGEKIKPTDLLVLRRYGIFGVPALIDEVRQNDSKHAFAARLIILGKREEYGKYLEQSSTLYPTKSEKLEAVKKAVQHQEAQQKVRSKLLDQIVKAAA